MTLDFTTGRDRLIVCRALAFAIVTIEKLPKERRPTSDLQDMKNLLSTYDERMMAIYLASAKCAVDDVTGEDAIQAVYRSYGVEWGEH
jgi:hypothetical protein